jgi:hypothetical protein
LSEEFRFVEILDFGELRQELLPWVAIAHKFRVVESWKCTKNIIEYVRNQIDATMKKKTGKTANFRSWNRDYVLKRRKISVYHVQWDHIFTWPIRSVYLASQAVSNVFFTFVFVRILRLHKLLISRTCFQRLDNIIQ